MLCRTLKATRARRVRRAPGDPRAALPSERRAAWCSRGARLAAASISAAARAGRGVPHWDARGGARPAPTRPARQTLGAGSPRACARSARDSARGVHRSRALGLRRARPHARGKRLALRWRSRLRRRDSRLPSWRTPLPRPRPTSGCRTTRLAHTRRSGLPRLFRLRRRRSSPPRHPRAARWRSTLPPLRPRRRRRRRPARRALRR